MESPASGILHLPDNSYFDMIYGKSDINYCQTPVKRFTNNLRSVKAGKGGLATRGFKTCVKMIATAGSQALEFTGNYTITC
jgi:hypothetical protein